MGFTKRLLEDQDASGFRTGRYFDEVCKHCIDDPALAIFVGRNGPIEECDFCGRTETLGMRVGDLFRYMSGCLRAEWDDPNNSMAWEGGFVQGPRIIDSDDLLDELGHPIANEDLHWEFVRAFDHLWCQRNPYRLSPSEMWFLSWSRFSEVTKTDKRYFWYRSAVTARTDDDELLDPAEVPDTIGRAIVRTGWRMFVRRADLRIIRARVHDPSEQLQTADQLGSPPSATAGNNRMSGAGISMFYGAESERTAISEVRPDLKEVVTVGTWRPSRELVYLNVLGAKPIPSMFDMTARVDRPWLQFLAEFADDLARPIDTHSAPIEYVPTQIMTEYIRDHLRTADNRRIDAIRYPSSIDEPGGVCWVVFAKHDDCGDSTDGSNRLLLLDADSIRQREPAGLGGWEGAQ